MTSIIEKGLNLQDGLEQKAIVNCRLKMHEYEICCVGHITLDKVVTPRSVVHMAGGTAFYFSYALSRMDVRYTLVTALAKSEMGAVEDLKDGCDQQ